MKWMRIYYPFEITNSNNAFFVTQGLNDYTGTMPTGTYYAINEDIDGKKGFWKAFLSALNSVVSGAGKTETYSVDTFTDVLPFGTSMSGLSERKIRITNDEDLPFEIEFGDMTLPPELFGMDPAQSVGAPDPAASVFQSDYTFWGAWQPRTLFTSDHLPKSTKPTWRTDVASSRERRRFEGAHYEWEDEQKFRDVMVEGVAAAHVLEGYTDRREYAKVGGIDQHDPNNLLVDVWRQTRKCEEFLALWEKGDTDLDGISALGDDAYDWCKLDSSEHQNTFDAWHTLQEDLGDFYNVDLALAVTGGNYA